MLPKASQMMRPWPWAHDQQELNLCWEKVLTFDQATSRWWCFHSQVVQDPMPCFSLLVHYQLSHLSQSITELTPQSSLSHSPFAIALFLIQLQWLWFGPQWQNCVAQGKIKLLFQCHLCLQAFGLKQTLSIPWTSVFIIQIQYFGQLFKAPSLILLSKWKNTQKDDVDNSVIFLSYNNLIQQYL